MTTISKAGINSNTGILTQQLGKGPSRQTFNKDASLPVSGNAVPIKPENPDSQLGSLPGKWSNAKQATNQWGNITREINQSKKAFAAEVLRRVKEQIRILMMLTGGDPKARARQIALLARELAAAVREYASASGDTSQGNAASTADSAVSNAAGASSSAAAVAEQPGQNVETAAPNISSTTSADAAEPMLYQPGSTHQVNEQLGNKISEYTRTSSASLEDQAFAMEVRKLAAQLKALAKQNEVHTHKRPDQSTEREMANIYEALGEIEKSLSGLDAPDAAFTPSVNIVAG